MLAFGNAINEISLESTNEKMIKDLRVIVLFIMTPLFITDYVNDSIMII